MDKIGIEDATESSAFRTLFDQMREAALLVDLTSLRIRMANPSAHAILGAEMQGLEGTLLPDLAAPGNKPFLLDFIKNQTPSGGSLTIRLQGIHGEDIPCDLVLRKVIKDSEPLFLVTFQDLSERIRAIEEIELRNIAIANVKSGVVIADARQPDLPLIYVNRGFQEITGYSAREAVGRSCRFLQGEDRDQPELNSLRKALRSGEACVVQLRNYRKDGTRFYNELHISPAHSKAGDLTHFVGIQLDVTEQVKARESLKRSEQRYRQALEREQELNEIKTRFISMVSHEFRTPMTGIQASASLLRHYSEKLSPEKKRRHLLNIENSLKRMNRLLDDVLFFSRAEAEKLRVSRRMIDLTDYFQKLTETLGPIHPGREIQVENKLPTGAAGPHSFPLDEHLLDHIFHNLIGNALKYSPPDSPVICRIEQDSEMLLFTIVDQGIGVPKTDQRKLFEAFHRASNVGTRQGTGLGLNIALRAVELLQGSLDFTSNQDKGSTFLVRLPVLSKNIEP